MVFCCIFYKKRSKIPFGLGGVAFRAEKGHLVFDWEPHMNLGDIIRRRREDLGITQDQVSVLSGISKPYLSNIETGRAKNPPTDGVLESLADALRMDQADLLRLAHLARTPPDVRHEHEMITAELSKLRGIVKGLIDSRGAGGEVNLDALADSISAEGNVCNLSAGSVVPVINNMTAGYPANFTDLDYPPGVADEYVRCPDLHDPQAFAVRVVGDSMEPEFHEGDIVVFSPNTQPRPGDDCFIRFVEDGGTTFKRFYQDDEATIRLQPRNNAYPAVTYPAEQVNGLWPAMFRIEQLRKH